MTTRTARRAPLAAALAAAVALAALLAHAPALENGFVTWDDPLYVREGPASRPLTARSVAAVFTSFHAGNYHPLTTLSHALDVRLFGGDPRGHHAVNLALHALNALLVLLVLRLLGPPLAAAAAAALLFAVHPLHVEAVAWVSQRKELLCALFFLAALAAYLRHVQSGARRTFPSLAFALFVLAALSKPTAVTFPLVMLLCDRFHGRPVRGRALLEKLPFLLVSLLVGGATVAAQLAAGAVRSGPEHAPWQAPFVAAAGLLFYLGKLALPLGLSPLYPHPWDAGGGLPWLFFTAPVVVAAGAAALFPLARRSRELAFGLAFFAVVLLPVLQIVPVGHAFAADRYAYLPSVGILFLVSAGLARPMSRRARAAVLLGCALLAGLGIWQSRRQARVWRDSVTLWTDVVARQPRAFEGWVNLSVAVGAAGDVPRELNILEETIGRFAGHREVYRAHRNRGAVLMDAGHPDLAADAYRSAIALKPDFVPALEGLGSALMALGKMEEARGVFEQALAVEPRSPGSLVNLGIALSEQGDVRGAVARYRRALEVDPASVVAHYNLGVDLAALGEREEGRRHLGEALRLDPGFEPAREALARLDAAGAAGDAR